jgi:hypothetical protein
MGTYYASNGTDNDYMGKTDYWGMCAEDSDPRCRQVLYSEWLANKDGFPFGTIDEMQIFEPCNYVSNVAYYHSTTRICDYPDWSIETDSQKALKNAFATLSMGSAMWHGSHTYVGYSFDNNMISVIAYLAHQDSVAHITDGPRVTDLDTKKRATTSQEIAYSLTDMFLKPVPTWAETLDTADMPEYMLSFSAIFATTACLILPFEICSPGTVAVAHFLGLPSSIVRYLSINYLPSFGVAMKNKAITN